MKSLMRAAAVAAVLSTSVALPALAQPPGGVVAPYTPTTLNLSAFGEVRTPPDMATITLGVMTQGPTAEAATRANGERMNAVTAALRRAGLNDRDIQTSGLNLNPQYVYQQNEPPRLTGYNANNQVTIRVMDLARLGPAIDAAVGAGANEVQGIAFGLRNPAAAEDEARRRAVQSLRAKAGVYAQATGLPLGRLINLSEGGGYSPPPPRPIPMLATARMEKADATSISPGELSVRVDVSAVYELGR